MANDRNSDILTFEKSLTSAENYLRSHRLFAEADAVKDAKRIWLYCVAAAIDKYGSELKEKL